MATITIEDGFPVTVKALGLTVTIEQDEDPPFARGRPRVTIDSGMGLGVSKPLAVVVDGGLKVNRIER